MKKQVRIIIWITSTLVFTGGVCYGFSFYQNYFPFDSFIFAFELNFLMMAWFSISTPYLKSNFKWNYFLPKKIENNGKVYNHFGLKLFRKALVLIGWEKITNSMNMAVKKDFENLKSREQNTRSGEFSHLLIAFIILILTFILTNSISEAKWLILTNIIFHIYPIFIQRYNRPRYLRVINLIEKRVNVD